MTFLYGSKSRLRQKKTMTACFLHQSPRVELASYSLMFLFHALKSLRLVKHILLWQWFPLIWLVVPPCALLIPYWVELFRYCLCVCSLVRLWILLMSQLPLLFQLAVICRSNQNYKMVAYLNWCRLLFLSTGNISKKSSLFTYDSKYLLDTYSFPPSHDPAFVPAFSQPEPPGDPLVADMLTTCVGEGAQFCKYDTLTTRSLAVGSTTLGAYQNLQALMEALRPGTMWNKINLCPFIRCLLFSLCVYFCVYPKGQLYNLWVITCLLLLVKSLNK